VICDVPVQAPGSAVSVSPARGVPPTDGRSALAGATGVMASPAGDEAVAVPAALPAVTSTRTVWPTRAPSSVSVASVASSIGVHVRPSPSQRTHW
jgi:hypothetical protein